MILIPSVQIRVAKFRITNRDWMLTFRAFPPSLRGFYGSMAYGLPAGAQRRGRPKMSMFKDPFDPRTRLAGRCGCGGDHAEADHGKLAATALPTGEEDCWNRVVDAAVLRAVFPV